MCMVEEGESDWVKFGDRHPRARVGHTCGECGRRIEAGEVYLAWSGRSGYGGFDHGCTCAHCERAADWLLRVCNGYLYNAVHMDLHEHWCEEPEYRSLWLGRVLIGMKRRWRATDGSLMPVPPVCPTLPHERLRAA